MKIRYHLLALLTLSLPVVSGNAYSANNNELGYTVSKSSQTFVLDKASPLYNAWHSWVMQQNADRNPLGGIKNNQVAYDVGVITIIADFGRKSRASSETQGAAPPNNGPPAPLPSNGTPGQKITIINQTQSIYQKWTYVWTTSPGGGGGWNETSYTGSVCTGPKAYGRLCTADAGGGE